MISNEEWLKRCKAQFIKRAALSNHDAHHNAIECLVQAIPGDSPEDAADDEMSCWEDDGDE